MLLPAWIILLEAISADVILGVLWFRYRDPIAGSFFFSVMFFCVVYALADWLSIETMRLIVRYGFSALFMTFNIVFGRILWLRWTSDAD